MNTTYLFNQLILLSIKSNVFFAGSDYTEGVAGIGIVNAVEVVNAFNTDQLLKDFRNWIDNVDTELGKGVKISK